MCSRFFRVVGIRDVAAAAFVVGLAIGGRASAVLFTPGDLIVNTYGSSAGNLADGAPSPINLVEYSTSGGAAVLVDTLPTTNGVGGSANVGVVGEYASSSEGLIQLSGNGQYLTLAGYSATAAAAGLNGTPYSSSTVELAQSTDTSVPRVGVLVDANGNVNSSTVLNDVYNTNNPRSFYSATGSTGSTFYISGQGDGNNSDQGIFTGAIGLNTVTSPGTPPAGIYNDHDTRFVTAYKGNLYYSLDNSSGSKTGIWEYSGMPTSSATATQILPGNGVSGSNEVYYSPEAFYFANATTLYVADSGDPKAGPLGDGGIQKWTYNGSKWTLQYTLTPTTSGSSLWIPAGETATATSGQSGFESLTGEVVGTGASATVDLFAVSYTLGHEDPDGLYAIDDSLDATSGAGENFTELESVSGDGTAVFKSVAFAPVAAPEPANLAILSVAGLALLNRRVSRKCR